MTNACRAALAMLFCSCLLPSGEPELRVAVGRDADGRLEAILENSKIRVRYGWRKFKHEEGFITHAALKAVPGEEQADNRIDAAAHRGVIRDIRVTHDDAARKTIRIEWHDLAGKQVAGVEEISIVPGAAWLKIDYLQWPVNIVDIASPGGTHKGLYAIHGAERWKRGYVLYPSIYYDRLAKDVGYQNITEIDDAGPLDCDGWFLMGVYNPENNRGFGRAVPVEAVDIIKLLHGRGFELFPYARRPRQRFSSFLYFVTGGRDEIISAGRALIRTR